MKKYDAVLDAAFRFVLDGENPQDLEVLRARVRDLEIWYRSHEPTFIIRVRDRIMPRMLTAYLHISLAEGASQVSLNQTRETERATHAWQEEHFREVRVAD